MTLRGHDGHAIEKRRLALEEQLKDRQDYRAALIERQESTERKIKEVEEQIAEVRKSLKEL